MVDGVFIIIKCPIPHPLKGALMITPERILFTDASVDPHSQIGFGAYLIVNDTEPSLLSLKTDILVKRFENTSSTTLELQVLLWALSDPQLLGRDRGLKVYTDSQNIVSLPARRARLEKNNYYSGGNKRHKNYALYQEFFTAIDRLNCQLIKVQGHQSTSTKNDIDKLFTLVDRASRAALRNYNKTITRTHKQ